MKVLQKLQKTYAGIMNSFQTNGVQPAYQSTNNSTMGGMSNYTDANNTSILSPNRNNRASNNH